MTPDLLRLRNAIESLAFSYPHFAEPRDLAQAFAAWWEHERPHLAVHSSAWNQAISAFFEAYLRSSARAFSSSSPQFTDFSPSRIVHAGIHLALLGGRADLPTMLAQGARGLLSFVSSRQKG